MTLERRALGATGHASSVLAFGAAAITSLNPKEAEAAIEDALERGVNHFDVAPFYGPAEGLLGPSVTRHREQMFLACKTRERKRFRARDELERSLERLQTDRLDLYQCHAVSSTLELDQILGPRGAIETLQRAQEEGVVRFLGITGHHCGVLREAIERFPFDTVMFPLNAIQAADPRPGGDYRPLLATALERGVGLIAIKSVARGPWPNGVERSYTTWYRPFHDPGDIEACLSFTLSHDVTTAVLPSDVRLWPAMFDAIGHLNELADEEIDQQIRAAAGSEPLYVEAMLPARQAYGPASST